ncbi:alpha/beta fold hydrolase [Mycolicibacterium madagascariense]|uniref:alpha/beta fold hydrolase n=1 Tax=Mycolicibacterium madagascariense TaxID=212765 RepID=UPI0013CF48E0|nr:alpha/beta hydrolase [Mycolicibacterium madagascariense]MCV7014198.1 alpha/beta hydrolase [Mycolicibacterium madagascariense]
MTSADGTTIGHRRYGSGPGVVLVQGAMGVAQHYDQLAQALAAQFTVLVPDRRGRGTSAKAFTDAHTHQRDVEDVQAVLDATGARLLFGLSSGALIAIESARQLPSVTAVALYEPPFQLHGMPTAQIERLSREVDAGRLDAAFVTLMRIVKLAPAPLLALPRPLLAAAVRQLMRYQARRPPNDYAPMTELIPSTRYDLRVLTGIAGRIDDYRALNKDVLLLGGTRSPRYLREGLTALEATLPRSRRVTLPRMDHTGPWNADQHGQPDRVASELAAFFLRADRG